MEIKTIVREDKTLHIDPPLCVLFPYEKGCGLTFQDRSLDIDAAANDRDSLVTAIEDDIIVMWDEYAEASNDELTTKAIRMKKRLRSRITVSYKDEMGCDKKNKLEENGWRVGTVDDFLRPVCYILIGNIASGKTTYVQETLNPSTIVVCGDNITDCVHAKYTEYSVGLKPLYKAVEHTIITQAAAAGRDIVIDRMNASRKSRQRYISLAKSLDYSVVGVIMDQSSASVHAARRHECDSRGVPLGRWVGVANGFVEQYEKPTVAEGFDDIRRQ